MSAFSCMMISFTERMQWYCLRLWPYGKGCHLPPVCLLHEDQRDRDARFFIATAGLL